MIIEYKNIKPKLMAGSIEQIGLSDLWEEGIRGLIIDVDNTISPWHQNIVTPEADVFIKEALQRGYKVSIVSNSSYKRSKEIADFYGISFIAPAYKPSKFAYAKVLSNLGLGEKEVAVIGDQIFTDILGGNRMGLYTILVPPLYKREFIWTRFMRMIEKLVLDR